MNCSTKTYPLFDREIKRLSKRYRSIRQDYINLLKELKENPEMGVGLGGGLHKVRMAISSKGKGKSGGARVITVIIALSEDETEIGLHYIYDKSERSSISDKELISILKQNGVL